MDAVTATGEVASTAAAAAAAAATAASQQQVQHHSVTPGGSAAAATAAAAAAAAAASTMQDTAMTPAPAPAPAPGHATTHAASYGGISAVDVASSGELFTEPPPAPGSHYSIMVHPSLFKHAAGAILLRMMRTHQLAGETNN